MAFTDATTPTLADFLDFLATVVQIPANALPSNSPYPQYALTGALDLVLCPPAASFAVLYTLAVYNGATHMLLLMCPDQSGVTFFADRRRDFKLLSPSTGIVVSSSDEGTSSTLAQPDWASRMTVGQLDFFRTPWGRAYLSYQQSSGPNIIGLT